MSTRLRILLLVAGEPVAPVRARRGEFARWFTDGLRAAGLPLDVEELDVRGQRDGDPLPPLAGYDGALMTGSAAFVDEDLPWMRWGQALLRRIVADDVPYLGVCFGHQMLGRALDSDVGENPRGRAAGTVDVEVLPAAARDPLFAGLPPSFPAHVTHRDVVRAPSAQLTVLARAPHDPCHAVRAGRRAWGVQFHPEFDDDVMRGYLEARAQQGEVRAAPVAASVLRRFARLCAAPAASVSVDEEVRHGA